MKTEELLATVREKGVILTPRLRVSDPAGAVTPELRAELGAHKAEILALLNGRDKQPLDLDEALGQARRLRDLYIQACMELGEMAGWPRLPITKPITVCPGEANWRLFLHRADVLTLRETVIPRLNERIAAIPPPDEPGPNPSVDTDGPQT